LQTEKILVFNNTPMQIEVTHEQLLIFSVVSNALLSKQSKPSKFSKALERVIKYNKGVMTSYNEQLEELRINLASEDDKKNLIVDEKGNYVYTRANQLALTKAVRDLNKQTVKVNVYQLAPTDLPALHPHDVTSLTPFVIAPVVEEEETEELSTETV
jgi:hypothetical protein